MHELEFRQRYAGLLIIGDPHLEARKPGFRKDDYPRTILNKLTWLLDYAQRKNFFPLILGDLFHLPRNNPNWLLVEIIRLFVNPIAGIYGNHDVHENVINSDDSISVIAEASNLHLLDEQLCLRLNIEDMPVLIGGTPWGRKLPDKLRLEDRKEAGFVLWLAHHDLKVPGYEEQGWLKPKELPGIDVVVNGHIHRNLEPLRKKGTLWLTPGNISRRSRGDAVREHVPSALVIHFLRGRPVTEYVEVPHEPFDTVFYPQAVSEDLRIAGSAFVDGLSELQARRTESGEGLNYFLEKNLGQFESDVAEEIQKLAREVLQNGE